MQETRTSQGKGDADQHNQDAVVRLLESLADRD